eukprot:TRINITY_DN3269_c0_g2_i1.p1 TRINITY_DN3269_c0_g2~~TRINITY_DN3269_c0_g2_i1.p1  ORF type:complete len:460 (-),score=74.58 TRINITY_DN3269_c0_g2_i1:241-1620(-)
MEVNEEDERLLGSNRSDSSRTRGLKNPLESSLEPQLHAKNRDIFFVLWINFLSTLGFTIVLPTIWPFIDEYDGSKSLVGWAVALHSVGNLAFSLVFGYWADKRNIHECFAAGLIIFIFGNIFFACSNSVGMILVGRFFVGISAGMYGPATTYLSYATKPEARLTIFSYNESAMILGLVLGPAFAGIGTAEDFHFHIGELTFSENRNPAWLCALLGIITLPWLSLWTEVKPREHLEGLNLRFINIFREFQWPERGGSLIGVLLALNAIACVAYTVFETVGTPYTDDDFDWHTLQNSIMWAIIGMVAISSLMILQVLTQFFHEYSLLLASELCLVVGYSIMCQWGGLLSIGRFVAGTALVCVGYTICDTLIKTIYSKVLQDHEMGVWMGFLNASYSVARTFGPPIASYTYDYSGGFEVYLITTLVLVAGFLLNVYYRREIERKVEEVDHPERSSPLTPTNN